MAKGFDINSRSPGGALPSGNWIVVKIGVLILAVLIILIGIILAFHYNKLEAERQTLEQTLDGLEEKNREYKYYLNSPIDEYYIKKFAWEMYRLVPSDGKIYITDDSD